MTKRTLGTSMVVTAIVAMSGLAGCSSSDGSEGSAGQTEQGLAKRCTATNPCDDEPAYYCEGYVNANGQCMVWNPQGWWFTYNGCAPLRSYCNAYGSCWCY